MNNTQKTSEVTIDDLAIMIAKGFHEMDNRFKEVDYKFKEIYKKFDGIDKKFDSMDKKIDGIDKRLIDVETNMATKDDIRRLEVRFESLEKAVFNDHGKRIRRIETKLQIA